MSGGYQSNLSKRGTAVAMCAGLHVDSNYSSVPLDISVNLRSRQLRVNRRYPRPIILARVPNAECLRPMLLQQRNKFVGTVIREVHPRTIDRDDLGGAGDQVGKSVRPFEREEPVAGSPHDERRHFEVG